MKLVTILEQIKGGKPYSAKFHKTIEGMLDGNHTTRDITQKLNSDGYDAKREIITRLVRRKIKKDPTLKIKGVGADVKFDLGALLNGKYNRSEILDKMSEKGHHDFDIRALNRHAKIMAKENPEYKFSKHKNYDNSDIETLQKIRKMESEQGRLPSNLKAEMLGAVKYKVAKDRIARKAKKQGIKL